MERPTRIAGESPLRAAFRSTRTIRGFTLVETLVTITIVGIAAAIATPEIADMASSLRIEGSTQAFVGDLNRARSEAIKRNASVKVVLAGAQRYRITGIGTRYLDDEVRFTGDSPDTVNFTGFGTTADGREVYTLRLGDIERTVVLDAAGQARVE